jgi:hypothetical protein
MAIVSIADGVVHVELRLWDKILAVHGSLHIPLTHIESAAAGDPPPVPWFSKLIGTNAPGLMAAGIFFTSEGLAFYDYGAGRPSLVLELHHERYARAVIEIDFPQTPEEAAGMIQAALAAVRSA